MASDNGAAAATTTTPPPPLLRANHDSQQHAPSAELVRNNGNVEKTAVTLLPPLTAGHSSDGLDDSKKRKLNEVLTACQDQDIDALKALATSDNGLISDYARRAAWPLLLGCTTLDQAQPETWQNLDPHRDEDQVALDVNRSFVYYPRNESSSLLAKRKRELSDTITAVLRRHDYLCYFQGYHDIVQVLLLVLGAEAALPAIERLSVLRIRDFMLPTMTGALSHLSLLPAILDAADHQLCEHLSRTAPFYFALSATLTLYAHEIQEYGDIARLFDFLLAHDSVVSIYFFTIIICSRKKQLLELDADEHDMLHSILSKLPNPLNLDDLIARTAKLYHSHPPERLRGLAWYRVSANSVLKTTRNTQKLTLQTLTDGERFFHKQAEEIKRHDVRTRHLQAARRLAVHYRRPALFTGTAIVVALLALYIRRPPPNSLHVLAEWGSRALLMFQQQQQR